MLFCNAVVFSLVQFMRSLQPDARTQFFVLVEALSAQPGNSKYKQLVHAIEFFKAPPDNSDMTRNDFESVVANNCTVADVESRAMWALDALHDFKRHKGWNLHTADWHSSVENRLRPSEIVITEQPDFSSVSDGASSAAIQRVRSAESAPW